MSLRSIGASGMRHLLGENVEAKMGYRRCEQWHSAPLDPEYGLGVGPAAKQPAPMQPQPRAWYRARQQFVSAARARARWTAQQHRVRTRAQFRRRSGEIRYESLNEDA